MIAMTKKETSTELATTNNETSLTVSADANAWGDIQADSRDLVIPKIMLMQAMSPQVTDGVAKFGDIFNSGTSDIIGGLNKAIKVLPFYVTKYYIRKKLLANGQKEYVCKIPDTGMTLPYEEMIDGIKHFNLYAYDFYCLIEGSDIPVIVSLKGGSLHTGKQLFTLMYINNGRAKLPPANNWISLISVKKPVPNNPTGSFAKLEMSVAEQSTNELLSTCLVWIQDIRADKVKIDDTVTDDEEVSMSNVSNTVNF